MVGGRYKESVQLGLPMIQVFVYGTVKPGEVNYRVCAGEVVAIRPAIASGLLYALPLGYPAMTSGKGTVKGSILSFANPGILSLLDEFEQHDPQEFSNLLPDLCWHQHQYQRQQIDVFDPKQKCLTPAWAYLMTAQQVTQLGGVLIGNGDWNLEAQRTAFNGRFQNWGYPQSHFSQE